jgi:NNP family nitrate/nitrite transporter-like MFS transporter
MKITKPDKHIPTTHHDSENSDGSSLCRHIGPLLLLTSIFFLNFTARVVFAPLMPEIENDLNISHAAAGSLFFLLSVGYFITLIGSGWVAAWLKHRLTIVLSSVAVGLVLIGAGVSTSLWSLRITMFLLGAAGGLYLPSGIATLMNLISSRHWGKATAVHELAPNTAFVAAPMLVELILRWFSWRTVPLLLGFAAVIAGCLFFRHGRGGDFRGVSPGVASFTPFLRNPAFWMMVFLFGMGISSTMGVYTMTPLYLVTEHGIDRHFTNTLVALSRISGIFIALAGGWATDRFGPGKTLIAVFLLTGAATIMMGAASGPWLITAVFLQPIAAVSFFPAGFAMLSKIGSAETRNIAVSLTAPAAFMVGGGMVPSFIGLMGETYSFGIGIILVGALITMAALPAYLIDRRIEK